MKLYNGVKPFLEKMSSNSIPPAPPAPASNNTAFTFGNPDKSKKHARTKVTNKIVDCDKYENIILYMQEQIMELEDDELNKCRKNIHVLENEINLSNVHNNKPIKKQKYI